MQYSLLICYCQCVKSAVIIFSSVCLSATNPPLQEMVGQFKLETYDIVRGPREWEEGTTERVQELYDQRMKEIEEAHRAEEEGAAAAQGS